MNLQKRLLFWEIEIRTLNIQDLTPTSYDVIDQVCLQFVKCPLEWAHRVIEEHPGAWDEMMIKRHHRINGTQEQNPHWSLARRNAALDTGLKCRHHIKAMRTIVKFGFAKVSDLVPLPDYPGKRRLRAESRYEYCERLAAERRAKEKAAAAKRAAELAASQRADKERLQLIDTTPPPIVYNGAQCSWSYDSGAGQYDDDDQFGYLQ